MFTIQGQRHSGIAELGVVKAREVDSKIVMFEPETSPLYSLTTKSGASRPTPIPKFEIPHDDFLPAQFTAAETVDANATVLGITAGQAKYVRTSSIWRNATTGEHIVIASPDVENDDLNISRHYKSTGPGAVITSGDVFYQVSENFQDGVPFVSAISTALELDWNYVQPMEESIEESDIQMVSKDLTKADWQHQNYKAGVNYKEKWERVFWQGFRDLRTGPDGKPIYQTRGVDRYIIEGFNGHVGHIETVTGAITLKKLQDWLLPILRFGDPNAKIIFGSDVGLLQVTRCLQATTINTVRNERTLGMSVTKVQIGNHVVTLIENKQFNKIGYEDRLYCIDGSLIGKRHLASNQGSLKTKHYSSVGPDDLKGRKAVIYGVEGFEMKNPRAHGKLSGFS